MRAVVTTSLLLVSILALAACGPSSKKTDASPDTSAPTGTAAVSPPPDFKQLCGDPVRFPLSEKCEQLAGDRGADLRRQSDLMEAVWRECALTPSSAETIRQEITAKGSAKTEVGQKMIGEMERTEQQSDSPCVAADLHDLDCVAGNSDACARARAADPACTEWLNEADTQSRLQCLDRAAHNQACVTNPTAPESDHDSDDSTADDSTPADSAAADSSAADSLSDSQRQAEDCSRIETACLHTFDECSNAKDALALFLKQPGSGTKTPDPAPSSQ